jgi:hypothetical protein
VSAPQVHLKQIEDEHGTGDASGPVRALLEYGMRKKLASEINDRAPGVHVSDAGRCPRQVFFSLTGVPRTETLTLDSYMTLNLGKKAEELYLDLLEHAGVKVMAQQRVTLDHDGEKIHGTLDLLIEVPEDVRALIPGLDPREIWELKTKNTRALAWLVKKGGPDAEDGYVKQLGGYLHGAQSGQYPPPTKARGRLIYTAVGATKGEPLFHAWFVDYNDGAVTEDLARLSDAAKNARAGIDPGIPEAFKGCPNFPCNYCDWKGKCFPR